MTGRLSIRPLNPNIGSEITGACARDFTDLEISALMAEAAGRGLVVLPDQFVTATELGAFGARFGPVFTPVHGNIDGTNGVTELKRNDLVFDDPTYRVNQWHTDSLFMEGPASFTFLSCVQPAPNGGGDTIWCNQYLAYETLPDDVKRKIQGLRISYGIADFHRKYSDPSAPAERAHPLVRVHAETGRTSLYISGRPHNLTTPSRIEGLSEEDGVALHAFLYQHCQKPEHGYRHRWRQGDLVVWDNRCTLHYAVLDYDRADERTMLRLWVIGEVPIPAIGRA